MGSSCRRIKSEDRWLLTIFIFLAGLLLTDVSHASFDQMFGSSGRDGSSGQSGYSGRSGADIEVKATGQREHFDLRGEDGSNGSPGYDGEDAYSCYQYREAYDLYGAPGGDGGSGGAAGNGGSGGDIRVYFADIAHLREIFVDSTPGRAGYPGEGSRGGLGCRCNDYSWERRVCHQEKHTRWVCTPANCDPKQPGCNCRNVDEWVEVCNMKTFYCRDGQEGREGRYGSQGSNGSFGSIQLIGRLEPLEPTSPSIGAPVENLPSVKYTLTRHEWDYRQGAMALFAPGSRIRNDYSLYAGKTIKTVSFQWLDSIRAPDYYRGERIGLSLEGHPASVAVSFPYNLLADRRIETMGDHTAVTVKKTMKRSELTQIRVQEMEGTLENLTLVLIDDANVSDVAKTKILLDTGWDLEGGGEFDNWVPDELIRSEAGKIYVNIGRLPGIKASKIKKYFGEKCEFEMEVTREFAGASDRVERDGGNVFDIEKDIKKKAPIKVKMERE